MLKNYKTQSYKYLFFTIVFLIPIIIIVTFFLWLQIETILGIGNGDLFEIIIFLVPELVSSRFGWIFTRVFGSCVFNITLYNDKFELKRVFKNKIFFYSEVESLTQISPLTGFI